MVRSLISAAISLFLVAVARGDLQLVPKPVEYELDGVKLKQLAFSDGGAKEITYSPPRGWEYSGSANKLTLHPPNKPQAEATIYWIPLPEPAAATFDDQTVKKLVEETLGAAPSGSTNVRLVSQEKDPLMIERKGTFLVVVSYDLYGNSYTRSVMFLNRGKEQVRFQLLCRSGDFKELQKAFLGSQYSWQGL